ncbi:AAA family ATPase [Gordonibacter massiliensis (ex Traore et al. 2017)]|uniref:AAA family ATPase n=1 Tax=Gordonibacter massiliensis (ex Traore et al. 2017) TaxID=1841863 RepID=UPI001C8BAB5D|nr:chromosome partitioning protein ParA [Gordonibacter massiliensis (ex Traore et al. 2017)]MBX9032874.1 chromosome partitioning protein ParA [Gordonibacter massiliensis (ex Traore et al. 2017)]
MTSSVALCADAESIRRPDLIGLAGENLARQEWLRLFTSGEDARRFLRGDRSVSEAWVAGCDDVEPINLAAALKRDRADLRVCLLAFEGTGSLMSRAAAAGIDASLTRQAFVDRYAQMKRKHVDATGEGPRGGFVAGSEGAPGDVRWPPSDGGFQGRTPAPRLERGSSAHGSWRGTGAGAGDLRCEEGVDADRSEPRCAARVAPAPAAGRPAVAASRRAFVLPVVSGSGGAGKSTVSTLSALFAQGLGYRTLLLDFDLRFGDVHELSGVPNALGVDEALAAPARIASLAPDGLVPAVLAAPKRLEDAEAVVREAPRLLDELQGRFDVIVANTGASWAEEHALLLERCSKALFLVDQRPSSLRACRHALELCARCGIATGPFLFAANRCAKGAPLTSIDVSCALRGAAAVELREGGGEVEELMGAGQPLDLIAAKNDLCTSLEHVLVDVLPGCEGRTLSVAEPSAGRAERRFGRNRRRGGRRG